MKRISTDQSAVEKVRSWRHRLTHPRTTIADTHTTFPSTGTPTCHPTALHHPLPHSRYTLLAINTPRDVPSSSSSRLHNTVLSITGGVPYQYNKFITFYKPLCIVLLKKNSNVVWQDYVVLLRCINYVCQRNYLWRKIRENELTTYFISHPLGFGRDSQLNGIISLEWLMLIIRVHGIMRANLVST